MPTRVPYHKPKHSSPPPTSRARQEDKNFYCSKPWRALRAAFLATAPLCADCRKRGRITAAAHVHHVKPRKPFPHLALDIGNLEGLCIPCHNSRKVR